QSGAAANMMLTAPTELAMLRLFMAVNARFYPRSSLLPQLLIPGVSVEKPLAHGALSSLPVSCLFTSLVPSGKVHAVAICWVGLQRRKRTSRLRFCAVAAR